MNLFFFSFSTIFCTLQDSIKARRLDSNPSKLDPTMKRKRKKRAQAPRDSIQLHRATSIVRPLQPFAPVNCMA